MKKSRVHKYLAWLLVFAFVFSLVTGNTAQVMAKSRKVAAIKSVSLKIGKKKVTKKTYTMKQGEKKKLKVTVSPKKGEKTIKFTTSNKKAATVNKNGIITAKNEGTAKITVTVSLRTTKTSGDSVKKKAWVNIKVTSASPDKTSDTPSIESPSTQPSSTELPSTQQPVTTPPVTEQPSIENPAAKKSIVAYFSCTDNTKTIAEYVVESTGADIYRIEPSIPYTSADLNYNNADSRTSKEQNDAAARPAIAGSLPDLNDYEVVYLGYPIWWGQAPKIMYTFVESYDWSGKIVVPFCTSASSEIGTSATNLQVAARGNVTWIAGQRFSGSSSKSTVEQWVRGLDLSVVPTVTGTPVTPASSIPTIAASTQPSIVPTPDSATQVPSSTVSPVIMQTPDILVSPSVTEQPAASLIPDASELPSVTEPPVASPTPDVSELPLVTENPSPTPVSTPDISENRKSVVVYFSCTDNTKTIAEYVAESADADIYRIEPSVPYTSSDLNYNNSDSRTSKEQNDPLARPEIDGELPSLDRYENVYLGYPIWWGQAPKIMYTFIENCNLSGKTVIPFCTSASSGIGTSATNLQAADTSQATWLTGRRFSGSSPKSDVESWLAGLGL